MVRRRVLQSQLETEAVPFRQLAQIHGSRNASNLFGEAFDVVVLLLDFLPVALGINFSVIGRIHTNARFHLFDPRAGTDVVVAGLVDQVELSFGKADVRSGWPFPSSPMNSNF